MKTSQLPNSDTELHDLLVDQLRDILWAEKQLVKALPKMAKAAQDEQLSAAFVTHTGETKNHVARLEAIFKGLGLTARAKKCPAMEGLLKEADELAEEYADSTALDAALITAAQKVEHYEIASYGTIRAFAQRLGYQEAVKLLTETLDEEGNADHLLTKIATSGVNQTAAA
ncbi:ferritin-like domain-containing protein [Luteolibacter yonseiensis]|uniref:Ferritin-like domain-containing protein n=1 Tax=Luteolibacter yonseiensis TaxID=1144680 RepID=A0A934QYX0_9BACT|nr:ferritin-like domain-containing protein [Luteolibacter yonseiensis]MBK1815253.1 ferritin-like domain-containing protein [Luteolibacter yonseiensis]